MLGAAEIQKAILDNSPDGIILVSPEHKILSFNKTIKYILPYFSEKRIEIGVDFEKLVNPENRELYLSSFKKAINGENAIAEAEANSPSFSTWFEYRLNPVYTSSQELIGVSITVKNIDTEKRDKIEMQKIAETTKAIFENTTDSIVFINKDFTILNFNKAAFDRIKKYGNKELFLGADFRDFVYKTRDLTFLDRYNKALKGEISTTEVEMIDYQGHPFWVRARHQPIYSPNGDLLGVGIFSQHITEKKMAERAVEKLTETITNIFDNTNESILLISPDLKVLSFNKAISERIKRYSQKEIYIGADGRDYMYNRADVFLKMFDKAINGGTIDDEVELKDFNGNKLWIHARVQPTYRKNGELVGVSFFALPITEKKLAEIALQENEEKFKKIVESTPTPIVIADEQMNILLVNSETEKVFGYKSEELLGKSIRVLVPKNNAQKQKNGTSEPENSLFNTKESIPKITSVTKNGVSIIIENSVKTFYLNNKKYIVSIILDVTQRVKNEGQIANQIKKLQAIAWQQSHEIRRPVSNILGVFDLLQLQENISAEEMQKYLEYIRQSAKELDQIIHNIVDHTS